MIIDAIGETLRNLPLITRSEFPQLRAVFINQGDHKEAIELITTLKLYDQIYERTHFEIGDRPVFYPASGFSVDQPLLITHGSVITLQDPAFLNNGDKAIVALLKSFGASVDDKHIDREGVLGSGGFIDIPYRLGGTRKKVRLYGDDAGITIPNERYGFVLFQAATPANVNNIEEKDLSLPPYFSRILDRVDINGYLLAEPRYVLETTGFQKVMEETNGALSLYKRINLVEEDEIRKELLRQCPENDWPKHQFVIIDHKSSEDLTQLHQDLVDQIGIDEN